MKLCTETITVYNKHIDSGTKTKVYTPTVIDGVHWFGTEQVAVTANGLIGAKKYTIRIPVDASFSGKEFASPREYQKLSDRQGVFTLDEGDIIVRGNVAVDGATPSTLQNDYDEVITIIAVTDNRLAPNAPHWKVVCK